MLSLRPTALDLISLTDPHTKAHAVRALPNNLVDLSLDSAQVLHEPADVPGRPARPLLLPAREVPQRSVGTPEGHAGLIHSLVHIECNAVDLALDVIWRFTGMPPAFYADWLRVAQEEALHFQLLVEHLHSLGHAYGDFAAHDGLWHMAHKTRGDLLARMAIVPRTLEARGLDASPAVQRKLVSVGDHRAGAILDIILRDEVGHVAIGNHWYRWLCAQRGLDPEALYPRLVAQYDAPHLKPPFNDASRLQAGFSAQELAALHTTATTPPPT
jgi:uncharacterized ferritin-like protein (DUF455 family)